MKRVLLKLNECFNDYMLHESTGYMRRLNLDRVVCCIAGSWLRGSSSMDYYEPYLHLVAFFLFTFTYNKTNMASAGTNCPIIRSADKFNKAQYMSVHSLNETLG
jgi:hypothetical protein